MDQDRSVPNEIPGTEEDDPLVEECLRDALGPYVGALSPEEVAEYREFLIVLMQTHPATAALYQRLRKRPATVEASGQVARAGAISEMLPERDRARGAGRACRDPEPRCRVDGTSSGGRR